MRGPLQTQWLPAALLALALGAAGCVENDQSIVIVGNFSLDGNCEAPIAGGRIRPRGRLDIGLAANLNRGYYMVPRVQNLLPMSAGMVMGGMMGGQGMTPVEMNHVWLVGFEVDILPDPGQPITEHLVPGVPGLTRLNIPYAGGQITAMGGSTTGPVEVINPNAAALLLNSRAVRGGPSTLAEPYQTLTVRIRARTLRGGGIIFSNWLEFPIEICAFCLPTRPDQPGVSAYNPGSGSLFECPDAPVPQETLLSTCLPQQDEVVSCCLKDRSIVCGKQIPHKSSQS
ncbi:MAG: hypothetical protein RMK29_18980 [Myxococcales bacterium]|nr:hypothetical protein [Myxococcota bacterium]MDW8283793.1 hypothetical protein [Myxococcales bacterium]